MLLRDYQASSQYVNLNESPEDESDDVMVYRFTLYDSLSGLSSSSLDYPEVLRYATKYSAKWHPVEIPHAFDVRIKLTVNARVNKPWLIYTPVLEITYTERKPKGGAWKGDMRTDRVNFEVTPFSPSFLLPNTRV